MVVFAAWLSLACGSDNAPATPTPEPPPLPTLPGGTPAAPIRVSLLTTPIGRGQIASIELKVRPNYECSIRYVTPAGGQANLPGLANRQSDANGTLRWMWEIASTTTPGDGRVIIACGGDTLTVPFRIV
jgi:hypothetical protein